jgi:hypothetical protein
MVHDHVWAEAGMPLSELAGDGLYLCVGCLEERLGRVLTRADFTDAPINEPDPWDTPRLADRKCSGVEVASDGDR